MQNYSPFEKDIHQLHAHDLHALESTSEGWYVEYKQEVPNAASIAKSISALANTYGGWLFYGIAEKSKAEPVAGSFPGIAVAEVDAALQRMRHAVADQLSPPAYFETKVLYGPCDLVALAPGRAIICASVPWSPEAPHVNKDGRIYRRVADGSEPRPENDRFLLDQLWQRSKSKMEEYAKWHDRDPEFSEREETKPYVRILITPALWRDRQPPPDFEVEHIREIMGATTGVASGLPFDTVYTSAPGFTARQCANNDPGNLGLTWRLRGNLSGDVIIPLPHIETDDRQEWLTFFRGYKNSSRFASALERAGFTSPHIVDLNYLFNILTGVVEIQRRLHAKAGWTDEFFVKVKLLNVWRVCPFVDVDRIIEGFETNGVPVCLNRVVTSLSGFTPDSFLAIDSCDHLSDEFSRIIVQAVLAFLPVARAFGIPIHMEHMDDFVDELRAAGRRGMDVQRHRNKASTETDC